MDLQTIWFILLFVLLGGYAILDGFDLGVGILHLSGRTDNERRLGLQAIGPIWDGNEVWLLTGGGALFAAFPFVYGTVFSTMYLALYLVLAGLMGRAAAIEFRSKEESLGWRKMWDVIFFAGSLLPAILYGVALANVMRGLPIEQVNGQLQFTGHFFTLLNPFSIVGGVLSMLLMTMHGAVYLAGRSEGRHQERMRRLAMTFWIPAVVVYIAMTVWAMMQSPHLFANVGGRPAYWVLVALLVISMLAMPAFVYLRQFGKAMISSSAMIGSIMGIAAVSMFPNLVFSTAGSENNLTAYAHSSGPRTLMTMLVIALAGMPLVIGYTIWIYRVFKGKVVVDPAGY